MQYRALLPTMIHDWRSRFTGGDFPFFIVQLASFMAVGPDPNGQQQWPELREAQALTAQTVGNSALTVAIDLGNTADIHPKNKQEVGARLALNARAIAYGEKIEYSGPVYREMEVKENRMVLHFDHAKDGLVGGGAHSFAIAGEDKNFVWATAAIQGDSVVVFSPKIDHPVAVRYAWANNPDEANLYNKSSLPAVPFRTDMPK
jgi:sialate O-acetylesterase